MDLSKVTIRYGKLRTLQARLPQGEMRAWKGTPQTWKGVTFLAAEVDLKGSSFSWSYELADHIRNLPLPPEVRKLLLDGQDAPWVRGRIERVFRISTPGEEGRGEKSGLQAEFLAVCPEPGGSLVGVPFWCRAYYLKTGLIFSEEIDRPPRELAGGIADAFWSLLLADPHDLPDYRDRMFHSGTGIWVIFGVDHGQPFIEEQEEELPNEYG